MKLFTTRDIISNTLIDAKKMKRPPIQPRSCSKTFLYLATFLAWIVSKEIGKPVELNEGYKLIDIYTEGE